MKEDVLSITTARTRGAPGASTALCGQGELCGERRRDGGTQPALSSSRYTCQKVRESQNETLKSSKKVNAGSPQLLKWSSSLKQPPRQLSCLLSSLKVGVLWRYLFWLCSNKYFSFILMRTGRSQNHALMSLPASISHPGSSWPVRWRSVFTVTCNQLAMNRADLREKQEEQDSATDYVLATWGYLHLKLCQYRANPTYRCKIFAKAHSRAKVSQTNINRLKAARRIGS